MDYTKQLFQNKASKKVTKRLLYPDICKFIAIFLVTWSHCAQCVSGQTWPNFLFGKSIDIAFNMPLFMIISGWFINLKILRETSATTYINSKFKRLIIPAVVWFFINIIVSYDNLPMYLSGKGLIWFIKAMLNYYWYLTALFCCLTIIFITTKIFKDNKATIVFSIVLVTLCPFSEFANINFMFPFIWAGYILRKLLYKYTTRFYFTSFVIISFILIGFWDSSSTVYLYPFIPMHLSFPMIVTHIYRFFIGLIISFVIISIVKRYENTKISYLAPLGQYTLIIYVASITFLHFLSILLSKDYLLNQPVLLELISLLICILICIASIYIGKFCRKSTISKLLFLGE